MIRYLKYALPLVGLLALCNHAFAQANVKICFDSPTLQCIPVSGANPFPVTTRTSQLFHTQSVSDNNITEPGQFLVVSTEATTTNCTTTCFLEIWDSNVVPPDGDYTGNGPGFCFPIPTDTTSNPWKAVGMANVPQVPKTILGVSVVVSSGADCYHLTKVPAYISVQVE